MLRIRDSASKLEFWMITQDLVSPLNLLGKEQHGTWVLGDGPCAFFRDIIHVHLCGLLENGVTNLRFEGRTPGQSSRRMWTSYVQKMARI